MEFNSNMVETMKKNKYRHVFINETGEWLFHSFEGSTEFSREEVVGVEKEVSEFEKVEKVKKGKK